MDYKEKYYKLVEAVKVLQEENPSDEGIQNWVNNNVPELAESEGEKIRRTLLQALKDTAERIGDNREWYSGITYKSAIAWLEKQNEQKSTNKIEQKFHEGDWVVDEDDNSIYQIKRVIENVTSNSFSYDLVGGGYFSSTKKNYHLWSIEDAKDGDVLADEYGIYIFNRFDSLDDKIFICKCAYEYRKKMFEIGGMLCSKTDVYPSTKEQRDTLFQKMHEAGYEWDAKNKELNKIYIIDEGKAEMDHCFTKMMNGEKVSSTWSEEDENGLGDALWCCKQAASIAKDENDMGNVWYAEHWLKSIKQKIGG